MRGATVKTPERVAEARRLRDRGMLLRELAAHFGVALQTVQVWISDPDGTAARARKDRYAGTCEVCGAATTGCEGPAKAPKRCAKHPPAEPHLARIAATRPKYERMVEMWNADEPVERIAAELGTTAKTVRAQLYRLRCRGWDVKHRRTAEQVANIAEGRFGTREPAYTFGALRHESAALNQVPASASDDASAAPRHQGATS
jgi:hypothetical protein